LAVRIVTDSTCDLPASLAHELGISVVPLSVIFGDEAYREGVDISHDLFYDKLVHSKVLPTTAAPSMGDFLAVYEELLKETDQIVSIHLSSKMSATYDIACQAAQILTDRGAKVEVVDSQVISVGMTFVALAAARVALSGGKLKDVRAAAEQATPRVHLSILVDTLEYVRRGGRIGRARAFLGTVLRVKPMLSLRDGEVYPEERVRTRRAAVERLFQIATSYPRVREVAVGYTTTPGDAEDLRQRLADAMPHVNIHIAQVGPVIGTHTGPGALGLGLFEGE
jgi:DegV family protein with EDD domain